ncbi:hypothetical protein [Streptomyces zaomyceticus]|uniref:hypothetical protein n=1 Tax=Streptomyces zaomyceticus TaxID=68286 RepID=UPI00342A7E26
MERFLTDGRRADDMKGSSPAGCRPEPRRVKKGVPAPPLLELPAPVLTAPPANARPALAPAGARGPVEQAVVAGALAAAGPETLLRTDIPQPDGSLRLYAAWTDGGGPPADRIDRIAGFVAGSAPLLVVACAA